MEELSGEIEVHKREKKKQWKREKKLKKNWTAKNNSMFWLGASLGDPKRSISVVYGCINRIYVHLPLYSVSQTV